MISGAISLLRNAIALSTPLPKYRVPPSRSSAASNAPVDAPLGTAARACVPSSNSISTSTVGFPRESRISRAEIDSINAIARLLAHFKLLVNSDLNAEIKHS